MSVKGVHSPGGCGRREFRDRPIQAPAAGSPGNARTGRGEPTPPGPPPPRLKNADDEWPQGPPHESDASFTV
ncbi:hypothetical protein GCM10027278_11850 [Paralcaligenes ginsengisoli]